MGLEFKPSKQGFNEFRNEGFIQQACLKQAQKVASIAGALSGSAIRCDVQSGRTRCHARASADISKELMGKKYWYKYGIKESDEAASLADAAEMVGGKGRGRLK